ncbi:ATP-binding protein [Halalkalibacter sp. APA_J-10(15)]|uniref:ATP-binding response regulator n=1 Tax=Halalkalibacter sp. APA_J-10(15) TaxID=2933805 RepID=UPI001FF4505B|nr:ATP-binding protein [Halalkalibacter sp. APA_J-10(15)]MCK0470170.1 ATP-binding protein [Halalkalibacter sp. APA_J-10(15)]
MSKKRILLIVTIFMIVLTAFRFGWIHLHAKPEHPPIEAGVLDLRGWDQLSDYAIGLDGEWEFYPNLLLNELGEQTESEYVQVPDDWTGTEGMEGSFGYGTYRLVIHVDDDLNETFGFRVHSIYSSSKFYVNGELIGQAGQPSDEKSSYEPLNNPYSAYVEIDGGNELEVMIQVANFHDPNEGGIGHSISFGLEEPLRSEMKLVEGIAIFACVIYLFHALYGFVLFLIGNRDRRLFFFSVVLLCTVIGTFIGERFIFEWFSFSFEWRNDILYVAGIIGGYSLLQCIRDFLPRFMTRKVLTLYEIACLISLVLVLILPVSLNLRIEAIYLTLMLLPTLLLIALMFKSTIAIDQDRIFLLLASIAAVGSLFWLVAMHTFNMMMVSYPFDLLIALTCLSTYWFKQYFNRLKESQQLATKLTEADRQKDQFLADVAHEMRNPLHGIINISQAVSEREKDQLTERSRQDLTLLNDVGRRMSLLLNDLLELARFRENRITLHKKAVSVQSAASAVISMLSYMVDERPITLRQDMSDELPPAVADENRLIQILFNLVHNAIKYSESGDIVIRGTYENERIHLAVEDQGQGMTAADIEAIFQPYEQVRGTQSNEGGFGLGLSICKQLVELHGCTLNVDSTLDKGSIFSFTLPVASESVGEHNQVTSVIVENSSWNEVAAITNESQSDVAGTIHLLVVDDDRVNLKVLESVFFEEYYQLCTVVSGAHALEKLDRGKWDIVISDVMMPQMTGYELTEQIRKNYSMTELPVLLLTAYNHDIDIEAGFRAGANDYVSKPVNGLELKARVESLVEMKRSVKEALRLEAAWLQAQIKPHFIINTFNAIVALSRIDLEKMDGLIEELSQYIRYSIHFQNADDMIPLKDELQLVRSYVTIEQERFPDYFEVEWKVDETLELSVPPLVIQTIVENAIQHGLLKRPKRGLLEVKVHDRGSFVEVSVSDNGHGIEKSRIHHLLDRGEESMHSGIGLANTNYRLKQLFGRGLQLESELGVGTSVSFKIPK